MSRGRSGTVVKPAAWDQRLLAKLAAAGCVQRADATTGEHVVRPDARWLAIDRDKLTFAALRDDGSGGGFALVLESDPEQDRLVLLPLEEREMPLDALASPTRCAELRAVRSAHGQEPLHPRARVLSARAAVEQALLGPPIPEPRRILAVAANFASHLIHDLDVSPSVVDSFRATPPRVFQKHPPMHAPGTDPRPELPFRGLIGPYDGVVFPDVVSLPDDEHGVTHLVPTILDYETELGLVLGRRLGWEEARHMSDEELWSCVAGYVLVSDVKARNPQVFERILTRREVPTEPERRYLTGDPDVDMLIGHWDEHTCAWWSYAASQGDYAALGPFLVEAEATPALPAHDIVCARSYAHPALRPFPPPRGREADVLYLRQCARTAGPSGGERLLWSPPAILRAILSPSGALELGPEAHLERGDVVALGTPGGIALTVTRSRLLRVLDRILFWWNARDWHDAFFGRDAAKFLHEGDRVFLWASGLGYQSMGVRRIEMPRPPSGGRKHAPRTTLRARGRRFFQPRSSR